MRCLCAPLLALAAVLPVLQGCASIAIPPGAEGAAPTDLIFGMRAVGGVNGAGVAAEAQKRQIHLVHLISESNVGNVDVIMRATLRGTSVDLETVSARTGETLTTGKTSYWIAPNFWKQSMDHILVNFNKNTALYKKVAAERDAAKPAGSEAISKAELERMVKSAVTSAPAPAASGRERQAPNFSSSPRLNDLAVIVGVETYSDIATKAPYAERDAEAVKGFVKALGVPERNIVLLTGSKAVRSGLVKTVEGWLPRLAKPDSRVYFYFSGHGAPDVKTGQAFLVPWDGDPNFLDATAYPVARLYEKLAELPAKQVLVALDSCFSGAGGRSVLASGARPLVGKIDGGAVPAKLTVLSASAADEISGSLEAQGHGAFTYFLLEGLNAGQRTPRALLGYLTPKVQDEARRLNRDQTPQLRGDGGWALR